MARTIKTTLELGGESAYKKGLQSIDRALKAMSSELKEATAKFSENSASLKNVSGVSNAYQNQVEQQKIKVDSLKGAVESSTKSYNDALAKYEQMAKEHGENSVEALKAADSLAKAEKSMDDFKNKLSSAEKYLDSSKKAMEEFTKQNKNVLALAQTTDKLKSKIAEFADKSDNVKKISAAFKDVQDAAKKISDKLTPVKNVLEKVKTGTNSVKGAFELAAKKAAAIKEKLQPAINVCKNVAKAAAKITFKAAETGAKAVTSTVNGAKKAFNAYTGALTAAGTAGFGLAASAGLAADDINTLSKQTGLSTEQIQKFQYASDLIDVDLNTLTGSMAKLTKNMATAQSGSGSAAEAFSALGVSISDGNGELRNNQDVFNEAIAALANIENETQRDAYAMQIFGKSAQDLNPLILGGADALKVLGDSANDAGLVLSQKALDDLNSFNDSLDIMKANASAGGKVLAGVFAGGFKKVTDKIGSAIPGLVSGLASIFDPSATSENVTAFTNQLSTFATDIVNTIAGMLPTFITGFNNVIVSVVGAIVSVLPTFVQEILPSLIEGFSSLVNSLVEYLPEFLPLLVEGALTLFSGLVDSLNQVIDMLIPMLPEIITQITTALIENLPLLLEGALQLFLGLIQALNQVVEQLMPMLPELITNLCDTLINNIPAIISAGFDLLIGLIQGITECIPTLVQKIPEIVDSIVGAFSNNIGELITAGINLIIALASGLPQAIPQVVMAIPQIITAIINALMEQDWLQVGIDIVRGLADGLIDGVNIIWDKIKEMASSLLSSIKSALGIHSPSKLFRDKVGIFLAQGVGVGFVDEMDKVTKDMQNALPTSFDTMVNADISSFSSQKNHSSSSEKSNSGITVIIDKVEIHNDDDIEDTAYKLALKVKQAEMALGV